MHCGRYSSTPLTRRQMLSRCANGFGAVALAGLWAEQGQANSGNVSVGVPHFPAKAKNVIFLFMDGGPSQMDTFDPKPRLAREHGQPIKMKTPPTQFNNVGNVLQSPWKFRPRGQSGTPVSDLFPHVAQCVDDLAVVRSMTSNFSEHTNANYFIHSGHGQQGRPCMGAWTAYGLGSECRNLPGFVVLNSGLIPPGGLDCFSNGFLPATFQGSVFQHGHQPVAYLRPQDSTRALQQRKLRLLHQLDDAGLRQRAHEDKIEAAIANYELAFRMQTAVPELLELSGESAVTKQMYGLDSTYEPTKLFASQCLLARRLVERGVRFVEVLCPNVGADRWDQHSDLRGGHERNARATDQPTAALLKDLKARGLLDETLVIWAGEFGRTPMAQGSDGRDHNPFGFSIWLAGGGIKPGITYGQTDDYGYFVVENKVEMHDLHATMLHLLGIDHKRLTVRFGGRDMRLTDVHGEVVTGILA
ncbi:DUF1501 domain-containing protein [soil metagenome]